MPLLPISGIRCASLCHYTPSGISETCAVPPCPDWRPLQVTVNNQMVVGTLMNICDSPNMVSLGKDWKEDDFVHRVPIIVTGAIDTVPLLTIMLLHPIYSSAKFPMTTFTMSSFF